MSRLSKLLQLRIISTTRPNTIHNATTMTSKYRDVEKQIQNAVSSYDRNKNANILNIAREFGVPYQRLWGRIHGIPSRSELPRRNQRLNPSQIQEIFTGLDQLKEAGVSISYDKLKNYADAILRRSREDSSTPPPQVSKMWPYRFMASHPGYFPKEIIIDGSKMNGKAKDSVPKSSSEHPASAVATGE